MYLKILTAYHADNSKPSPETFERNTMASEIFNRYGRALLAIALATSVAGCADRAAPRISGLPDRVELTAVPFYRGEADAGAPTALAALLRQRGVSVTPGMVAPALGLEAQGNALGESIAEAARRYGFVVYPMEDQFQALLAEVAAGNPILVRYRSGGRLWGSPRYALLVGYDRFKSLVVLRSGEQRREPMPFADFISAWREDGAWAVLVQPPGQLPARVNEARWRQAAARLGQAGQEDAARQALAALTRR